MVLTLYFCGHHHFRALANMNPMPKSPLILALKPGILQIGLANMLLWVILMNSGCRPDRFADGVSVDLRYETDTLLFDTVLVQASSITRRFKVYNPTETDLLIDQVFLGSTMATSTGSRPSGFRLNINGLAANRVNGLRLAAKDSIYIFAEVTVDPNDSLTPFLVTDSVFFVTGNRIGKVMLTAFGQNARFYKDSIIGTSVWTNEKPVVIYNSILVDSMATLWIQPGTKIYFNGLSTLYVLGTLRAQGTAESPIEMRGDRLDPFYRDLAGAWNGIHFLRGSGNHFMRHVVLRNGSVGIRVDSLPVNGLGPNLRLESVWVDHFAQAGIFGNTAHIEGDNILVSNCGLFNFLGDYGGIYRFRHSTFVHMNSEFPRSYPLFVMSNRNLGQPPRPNNASLDLFNCILWGSADEELALDTTGLGNVTYNLRYSILRSLRVWRGQNLRYANPRFKNPSERIYTIDTLSPAFRAGEDLRSTYPALGFDLQGRLRPAIPTLGCLERFE